MESKEDDSITLIARIQPEKPKPEDSRCVKTITLRKTMQRPMTEQKLVHTKLAIHPIIPGNTNALAGNIFLPLKQLIAGGMA